LFLTDDVKEYEQKFMPTAPGGFKTMFKRHIDRCKHKKLVNDLKEPKDFLEWILSGRKAKCYLCQADLSSTSAAGPQSKMVDRRNSKATNGNCKEDYTRDNICDGCQFLKGIVPEDDFIGSCCAVAYHACSARRQLEALRLVQLPLSSFSSLVACSSLAFANCQLPMAPTCNNTNTN
jgi:hypothetical protein